jgi:DNA-binding PadR family transcriptional regulator
MSRGIEGLLPQVTFAILFALSLRPRHGYELIKQIETDSQGRIKLSAGSLYGAIKQLREANFIEEMPFEGSARRRQYRLTRKGWDTVSGEARYHETLVKIARDRKLI